MNENSEITKFWYPDLVHPNFFHKALMRAVK